MSCGVQSSPYLYCGRKLVELDQNLNQFSRSFPENTGFAYSICDASLGIGYTLGPAIGSYIYDYGGYPLPFLVNGVAIFVRKYAYLYIGDFAIRIPDFQNSF